MTEDKNNTPFHTASGNYKQGSLESAIRGDYDFSMLAVLSESWEKTRGSKWTFQLAITFYFLIYFALALLLAWLFPTIGDDMAITELFNQMDQNIAQTLAANIATLPMAVGILLLGVRRAVDAPIKAGMIFGHYNKILPLAATMILLYLCLFLGFLLLVLPGLYLSFAYLFANYLLVDKNLSPWQALETSRKAVGKHWFKIVGFILLLSLIMAITTIITLGIALIWTIPLSYISMGILYRTIFGYEPQPDSIANDPLIA